MQPSNAKVMQLSESMREVVRKFRCLDIAIAHQPHGELSIPEVHVIEYLGDKGVCMMRELAEYLLVAVNTITSIVDKLEEKRFVRRERDDSDRRIVMVRLTDRGNEAYLGIMDKRLSSCRTLLTPLNEDEQDIFMVLIRKIARSSSTDKE